MSERNVEEESSSQNEDPFAESFAVRERKADVQSCNMKGSHVHVYYVHVHGQIKK